MTVELQIFASDLFDALACKHGYDGEELARALGLPTGTVRALSGHQVSQAQARDFCAQLGLDIDLLLCGLDATRPRAQEGAAES